jgi:hypothetical protein
LTFDLIALLGEFAEALRQIIRQGTVVAVWAAEAEAEQLGVERAELFQQPGRFGVAGIAGQAEPALACGDGALEGEGGGIGQVRLSGSQEGAKKADGTGGVLREELQLFRLGEGEGGSFHLRYFDRQ